jgi:hypothetical protein
MQSLTPKEQKKSRSVKAPQSIVHIAHTPTLRQYKLWILLLDDANNQRLAGVEPDAKGFYRVQKSMIDEAIGYEDKKTYLEHELEKLRREPIVLSYLEKGGEAVKHGMGFVSEWKVYSKTIAVKFPSMVEEAMRGLEQPRAMFQLINWEIFNKFTGKYEAIIYKLCRDYVGKGATPYMTIEEFREYAGLKEGEYPTFKRLSEYVLKNPIDRINSSVFSDIEVSMNTIRQGRFVVGLRFNVKRKYQTSLPIEDIEENPAFQFAKVAISPTMQTEYLALRDPKEIEACIARGNEYGEDLSKKGKKPDYGAIYAKAIKQGWHTDWREKQAQSNTEELVKKAKRQEETKRHDDEEAKLQAERAERERLLAEFDALPVQEKNQIAIEATKGDKIATAQLTKGGYESSIVRMAIARRLRERKKSA